MKTIYQMRVFAQRSGRMRFVLGCMQMLSASFAIALLVLLGVNPVSLSAAVVASVLTMLSVLLFRK